VIRRTPDFDRREFWSGLLLALCVGGLLWIAATATISSDPNAGDRHASVVSEEP
jgi:hypothetical protein